MKKQGIVLTVLILLSAATVTPAQEGGLGVTADVTWVSKYLWYGVDKLDDKAAWQPSVNVDLFGTGFNVGVFASYAGTSKHGGAVSTVNATEYRYIVGYSQTFFEGQTYQADATVNWIYYDLIDNPDKGDRTGTFGDAQQIGLTVSLPQLCPAGFVPSYHVAAIWPDESGSRLGTRYNGWVHVFGVGKDVTVPGILPETPEQVLHLSGAAVFNDGFAGVNKDWSHALFGVSTDFEIAENVAFTPAVYYQSSWEDTANTEDEWWTSLGVSYKFK